MPEMGAESTKVLVKKRTNQCEYEVLELCCRLGKEQSLECGREHKIFCRESQ